MMSGAILLFVVAVVTYTASAALVDARRHRIPNYLTAPAALGGLAYHAVSPAGWGLGVAVAGMAIGFLLLLAPWLLGGGGMGDVKLLAGLGAWLGPSGVLAAFALSIVTAAAMAMAVLAISSLRHGFMRTRARYQASNVAPGKARRRVLPFALPVAVSSWAIVAWLVTRGSI